MKQPENTGVEMSSASEQEKTKMRLQDIFMAYCVNLMIWMVDTIYSESFESEGLGQAIMTVC